MRNAGATTKFIESPSRRKACIKMASLGSSEQDDGDTNTGRKTSAKNRVRNSVL